MTDHRNSSLKLKCNRSSDKMKTVVKNSKNTIGNLEKMDCKIESAIETLEVMSNPETLKRYKKDCRTSKKGAHPLLMIL